jgi:phosphoglycolate phosphatase-like HAD superfamily hydrolase
MTEWDCDAVLFDLDGVLVDSAMCVERHWRRWAAEHGLDGDDLMRFVHGRPTVETIRLVAPHLPAEAEAARLNASEAFDVDGVVAIPGAARLVRSLPPDTWAIATSGTRDTAVTRLRHTGLPRPSVLVTADDVTRGKPDVRQRHRDQVVEGAHQRAVRDRAGAGIVHERLRTRRQTLGHRPPESPVAGGSGQEDHSPRV